MLVLLALLVALGSLGMLAWLQLDAHGTNITAGSNTDVVGQARVINGMAPDFTLPDLQGSGHVSPSQLRGHVVVLNFWASWCEPCVREAPGLAAVSKAYLSQNVRFIGIDEKDSRPSALAFQSKYGVTYPSAFDPSGAIADRYRLVGLPTTVVIGPDGDPLYRFMGYLDPQTLGQALDAVVGNNIAQAGT